MGRATVAPINESKLAINLRARYLGIAERIVCGGEKMANLKIESR